MIFPIIVYLLCIVFIINKYHRNSLNPKTIMLVAVGLPVAFLLMCVFFVLTLGSTKYTWAAKYADKLEDYLNKLEKKVKGE